MERQEKDWTEWQVFLGEKSLEGINPSVLQTLLQTGNLSAKGIVAVFLRNLSEMAFSWDYWNTLVLSSQANFLVRSCSTTINGTLPCSITWSWKLRHRKMVPHY